MQEYFYHVETGGVGRDVVRNVKKIAAGSSSNAIFFSAIVIPFLFDHRVVVDDIAESIQWNIRVGDRN